LKKNTELPNTFRYNKSIKRGIHNQVDPSIEPVKSEEPETENTPIEKPIKIVNFHGNSKGDINVFKSFIENAIKQKVDFITGDSNITIKKTEGTSTKDILEKTTLKYAYSLQPVEKTRFECDMLLNNQLDKSGTTNEIDGMFVATTLTDNWSIPTNKRIETVYAFVTEYNAETPMLGDHSVVEMNGDFTLLSATGSSMDDDKNGIFGKKTEWESVNIPEFHTIGKKYTLKWISIYKNWAKLFNDKIKERYPDKDTGKLAFTKFDDELPTSEIPYNPNKAERMNYLNSRGAKPYSKYTNNNMNLRGAITSRIGGRTRGRSKKRKRRSTRRSRRR
jgi:hypothetical protein